MIKGLISMSLFKSRRILAVTFLLLIVATASWWAIIQKNRVQRAVMQACTSHEISGPVDVHNHLIFKNKWAYKVYALIVAPVVFKMGGSVWVSSHEASILGKNDSQAFIIVRYPSLEKFCGMVCSFYYIALANPVRELAIEQFNAAFTSSKTVLPVNSGRGLMVAAFINQNVKVETIKRQLVDAGGKFVYSSRVTGNIMKKTNISTNPQPLSYKNALLFSFDGDLQDVERKLNKDFVQGITRDHNNPDISIQVYRQAQM